MKLKRYNRVLLATDLRDEIGNLEVYIQYTGDGDANKGCAIDGEVIPNIVNRVNAHEDLIHAMKKLVSECYHVTGLCRPTEKTFKETLALLKELEK